jgi:fatty acid desaturase
MVPCGVKALPILEKKPMMTMLQSLSAAAPAPEAFVRATRADFQLADDKAMLRAARDLTKGLGEAKPGIYWADMILSAGVGYAGVATAILSNSLGVQIAAGLVAALALYRALMFIHELTHIHRDALPGFRTGWNLMVGIPMLTPSFMYEGVHTIHHKRTQYGTSEDPEYLPLALMKPWSLPLFVAIALLAPVALILRFAVLVPLGALIPAVRRFIWERLSALSINPDFRRKAPDGEFARRVRWQEALASLWAITLLATTFAIGWRPLLIALAIFSLTAVLNQLRTLVAHLWENEGEPMTVTAQFLDSVNVPPPGLAAEVWAPVGLRYHALHHLMPSMPYHDLPEAHRRLARELGTGSTYDGANHPGMLVLVARIARSTMVKRA